jgi:hypothetical protein
MTFVLPAQPTTRRSPARFVAMRITGHVPAKMIAHYSYVRPQANCQTLRVLSGRAEVGSWHKRRHKRAP